MDIELHAGQRIDQAEYIRAACLRRLRHGYDICHVRTQLHDDRLFCLLFHCLCDRLHSLRILTEGDAALFYIRAGNIDLQKIHRFIRQTFDYFQIVFRRLAADIYNDLRIILLQEGNIALAEHVDAGVLQTDGVQHAAGHFCDAGRRIA